MGIKEDFSYGRESQRKYAQKQKEKESVHPKKYNPNRLLVGAGIAYEMLGIDNLISKLRDILTPIFLIIVDDTKWLANKIRGKEKTSPDTSFGKWQAKERFSEIFKRIGK